VTRRLLLAAAAVAAALPAVPAHAAVHPVCATRLALAPAGTYAYCPTGNTPRMAGAATYRTLTVDVQSGVVLATLTCGYGATAQSRSITVSGPRPQSVAMYEDWTGSCRAELTALYDDTTALATSTFSYVFVGP